MYSIIFILCVYITVYHIYNKYIYIYNTWHPIISHPNLRTFKSSFLRQPKARSRTKARRMWFSRTSAYMRRRQWFSSLLLLGCNCSTNLAGNDGKGGKKWWCGKNWWWLIGKWQDFRRHSHENSPTVWKVLNRALPSSWALAPYRCDGMYVLHLNYGNHHSCPPQTSNQGQKHPRDLVGNSWLRLISKQGTLWPMASSQRPHSEERKQGLRRRF